MRLSLPEQNQEKGHKAESNEPFGLRRLEMFPGTVLDLRREIRHHLSLDRDSAVCSIVSKAGAALLAV